MNSASERMILEDYVARGRLVQIATLSRDGNPALCHVWYNFAFDPDRLIFMSRESRDHSQNIRRDERVAGGIVAIELDALGQQVQGVTFKGHARELAPGGSPDEEAAFVERWPAAAAALAGDGPSRLYEVAITEWVLFDELNFADDPRRIVVPQERLLPSKAGYRPTHPWL
jgi:uncharacterized protein YhbP (UPF0306 family)